MDNWHELPEGQLVGAILLDASVCDDVCGDLEPEHFGHRVLARIYRAARKLWQEGPTTQMEILGACQPEDQKVAEECLSYAATTAHAKAWAAQIKKEADRRALRSLGRSIMEGAEDRGVEPREVAEEAAAGLHMLTTGNTKDLTTIGQGVTEFYRDLQRRAQGGDVGLPTPFKGLDRWLGCLEPGGLYILGARPSVGKSAMAKQFASKAAGAGKRSLICILESSREAWIRRIVSAATGLSTMDLKMGNIREQDWPKLAQVCADLEKLGDLVTIWDCPEATPMQIRAQAMKVQRQSGLDLLIVDYLTLVNPGIRTNTRREGVAHISRQSKIMAKVLDVPVLMLAQLGRQVQGEVEMRRPVLTDLKEAGDIEQDADVVMFIHRKTAKDTETELLVAKQRDGENHKTVKLTFNKDKVSFEE